MAISDPALSVGVIAAKGLEQYLDNVRKMRNPSMRCYSGFPEDEPTSETLSLALEGRDLFQRVLSFETFEEDMRIVLSQYGLVTSSWLPHERPAIYRPPTQREQALIATYNRLDIALVSQYNEAHQLRDPSGHDGISRILLFLCVE